MKSIRISANNRRLLKQKGKTYDEIIEDLYYKTEDKMPLVDFDNIKLSPIKISDENYDRLSSLAISNSESFDTIITRMFLMLDEK